MCLQTSNRILKDSILKDSILSGLAEKYWAIILKSNGNYKK